MTEYSSTIFNEKTAQVNPVVSEDQQAILSGVNCFKEACTLVINFHLLSLYHCKGFFLSDDLIPEGFLYRELLYIPPRICLEGLDAGCKKNLISSSDTLMV